MVKSSKLHQSGEWMCIYRRGRNNIHHGSGRMDGTCLNDHRHRISRHCRSGEDRREQFAWDCGVVLKSWDTLAGGAGKLDFGTDFP